ncbi:cytochrome P450 [Streptomyces sp. N2-109]|uniref:Cytochrome P450 n=1 Tax=Streptomyces gossypii TaxID=2883101 RepID=A0ABT2JZ44_9ACTN|nr:cytochrome P450 [Streptomyces gossypii]MCT2593168.1 cytochrome P450 [Streptomyces gossypii]
MSTARTIPLAGKSLPFLGHALPLLRDPLAFLSSLPAYGGLVRLRLGPLSLVMVCDPGLTRQVLLDDRTYDMGGPIMDRARKLVGDGLGTCPRSRHRRQRRLCQPAFHLDRMPAYGAVMADSCNAASTSWQHGQEIDVTEEMSTLVMGIVAHTIFSATAPQISQNIRDDFKAISKPAFWLMVMPPVFGRLPTLGNRRYQRAHDRLRSTVGEIIATRRPDATDHGDLLSSLLSAQDPDSESEHQALSDREVTEQVINIFAGADAAGPTLAWALYLLATHPEVEERLHKEVDEVLAGGPPTFAHVAELKLADRVISEALRMYTPTWFGSRVVTGDTDLGGFQLPAKTMIGWSPYLIHRLPELYDNPDRFDPDRWLDSQLDREAYLPFGAGGRKCIGNRFGINTAALALASITSRWRLRPVGDEPLNPVVKTMLAPHGVRLRVEAR